MITECHKAVSVAEAARIKANAAMLAVLIPQCLGQPPGQAREALAASVLAHGGPDLRSATPADPE